MTDATIVREGSAVASTETIHKDVPRTGQFAFGDDGKLDMDRVVTFASRALFRMTAVGRQLVMKEKLGGPLAKCKLDLATKAAIRDCDAADGLVDGLVQFARSCRRQFDLLQCAADAENDCGCLSATEIKVLQKVWQGPTRADGSPLWPGLAPGMTHCHGGAAPNASGGRRKPPAAFAHLSKGFPVGRESRDRVRAALQHGGYDFPNRRLTVNLAPVDIPKDSGRFDLPIEIGVLVASGQIPVERTVGKVFVGELSLSGELRPIRGALAMALAMAREGCGSSAMPTVSSEDQDSGTEAVEPGDDHRDGDSSRR